VIVPPEPVPAIVVAPVVMTLIAAEGVIFRVLAPVRLIVSIALKPEDVPATAVATNVIVPASVTLRTSVVPAPPVKVEPSAFATVVLIVFEPKPEVVADWPAPPKKTVFAPTPPERDADWPIPEPRTTVAPNPPVEVND